MDYVQAGKEGGASEAHSGGVREVVLEREIVELIMQAQA